LEALLNSSKNSNIDAFANQNLNYNENFKD